MRPIPKLCRLAVGLTIAVESLVLWPWWSDAVAAFFGRRQLNDAEDFAPFYAAASLIARGHGSHITTRAALLAPEHAHVLLAPGEVLPYLNPPVFALLLTPLTALPFSTAYQVWTAGSLLLLALCGRLLWRTASQLTRPTRCALVLGLVAVYPTSICIRLGQFSFILVFAVAAAFLLLRAGRERAAGAALSLLLIKPELLIPFALFFAWKKHWRVFHTLLPTTALAVIVSIAIIGPDATVHYPGYLLSAASQNVHGTFTPGMYGWIGIFGKTFGPHHTTAELGAHVGATVLMAACAIVACRGKFEAGSNAFARQWAVVTACALLADPHLYLQDTLVIAPAAVALLNGERGWRRGAVACWLAVAALASGWIPSPALHINPLAIALAAGAIALIAAMIVEDARTAGGSSIVRPPDEDTAPGDTRRALPTAA